MPAQRQAQLIGPHAVAIVEHLDQPPAAVLDAHGHAGGPGVEAVLDQLLHHRGWAFDDLAGGDLVGDQVGQQADLGNGQRTHRSAVRAASGPVSASA